MINTTIYQISFFFVSITSSSRGSLETCIFFFFLQIRAVYLYFYMNYLHVVAAAHDHRRFVRLFIDTQATALRFVQYTKSRDAICSPIRTPNAHIHIYNFAPA